MVGAIVKLKILARSKEENVGKLHGDVIKIKWQGLACDVFGDEDAR